MEDVSTIPNETISYSERNLLWIDATSKKEMISAFIFFILIFISIIYFCFCSREEIVTNLYQSRSIDIKPKDDNLPNFDFDLSPIDYQNRFVRFSISFFQNFTDEFDETFSFNYYIKRLYFNDTHEIFNKNVTLSFHFKDGEHWTKEYLLYTDSVLDFKYLSIGIFYNANDTLFSSFEFNFIYGNIESTIFEAYFRTIFTILHVILVVLLIQKQRSNKVKYFRIEHKYIILLNISIIISNNPFCIYRLFYPTTLYYKWLLYTTPFADGMIFFIQIISFMWYSLRLSEKNEKELYLPENSQIRKSKFKMISFLCFAFSLLYMISNIITNHLTSILYYFNNFPSIDEYKKFKKINRFRSFVVIIYSLSSLVFAISSLIILNSLTAPPFIYLCVGIAVFVQQFLFEGIFICAGFLDEKDMSIINLTRLIAYNAFCMVFTLIHFPIDIREHCSQINNKGVADINNENNENKVLVDENDDLIIDSNQ